MATTKKTKENEVLEAEAEVKTTKAKAPKEDTAAIEENKALKEQLEQLKAQMNIMAQMMAAQTQKPEAPQAKERNITFVNLTPGRLVLKGSRVWVLDGQFAKRSFLEREARLIVANTPNAVHNGLVYILDAQFVEDNDLSEIYLHILSDEDLKTLLAKNAADVVEIYRNASDIQKKTIVSMIVAKRARGEDVDANILVQLGKLCGRDLVGIEDIEHEEDDK